MSEPAGYQRATFTNVSVDANTQIVIQFNPASLLYTVQNTLREGRGRRRQQYVSQSTGKLTMDLIYDTTHSGEDVRTYTEAVAKLMEPVRQNDNAPPVVLFEWGAYSFQGMMEGYKETIDFFSGDGVPLRAAINVILSRQDHVFEESPGGGADTAGALAPGAVPEAPEEEAVEVPQGEGDSPSSMAAMGGNPRAARRIAQANGVESLRASAGGSLVIDASISLGAPAAFATGAAGLGISGGAGFGLEASAGASFGASFGASASAGISASAGAFAGLQASAGGTASFSLRTDRLIASAASAGIASDEGASFRIGGQASVKTSAGLNTDVGATASLRASIQFED